MHECKLLVALILEAALLFIIVKVTVFFFF